MSLAEIEAALHQLKPDELRRVEHLLKHLQGKENEETTLSALEKRNGVEAFARRPGALASVELVQRICQEEGI